MNSDLIHADLIDAFQRDGVVVLRGLFAPWIDLLAAGIDANMANPSALMSDYGTAAAGEPLFFDDYCNWQRVPQFERVVRESPAAVVAAALMQSRTARFFHDHVLVKEAGNTRVTPWHADSPYYLVDGEQTVSFWLPLDPVDEATLRLVKGSHRWPLPPMPTRWVNDQPFYEAGDFGPAADPDGDPSMEVVEWAMEPGDAVAFHFRTVHGARANPSPVRRRAFSMRWVGDDARYVERPGRTSPPFTGHGMSPGELLRDDWFPVIAPAPA